MNTPSQGYLDWRANLKPGYYWIENMDWRGDPLRRIVEVIDIDGDYDGRWYPKGLYYVSSQWPKARAVETFAGQLWEGFRAEPVQPMSKS